MRLHADNTVDDVRNGIALSPSYHRAFDNGLIYLDPEYVMRINQSKADELSKIHRAGGIDSFSVPLERKIHLPSNRRQRPSRLMIRRANRFRRIAAR